MVVVSGITVVVSARPVVLNLFKVVQGTNPRLPAVVKNTMAALAKSPGLRCSGTTHTRKGGVFVRVIKSAQLVRLF